MPTIKRRIFSGSICEQEVFNIPDKVKNLSKAEPQERFKTDEDRARHREEISRRHFIRIVNSTFSPKSLYSTLTLDNDHEVYNFEDAKRIVNNYIRRLKYIEPDAQIVLVTGRGKSTDRIHFHMISNGLSEEQIRQRWKGGNVKHIKPLRKNNYYNEVNHGQDYTALANYLFNHWTAEQGGHRWKATKNIIQPEREEPTIVKRNYTESKPPKAPKGYKLVEARSNQYGYLYFKYVRIYNEKQKNLRH